MAQADHPQPEQTEVCGCFSAPHQSLVVAEEMGMDDHFAEVSLWVCSACGQKWLRYFYEIEAFTASGRWYLGAIPPKQASLLTTENAKDTLGSLRWYFYGGSYYGGRSGKTSGEIILG